MDQDFPLLPESLRTLFFLEVGLSLTGDALFLPTPNEICQFIRPMGWLMIRLSFWFPPSCLFSPLSFRLVLVEGANSPANTSLSLRPLSSLVLIFPADSRCP